MEGKDYKTDQNCFPLALLLSCYFLSLALCLSGSLLDQSRLSLSPLLLSSLTDLAHVLLFETRDLSCKGNKLLLYIIISDSRVVYYSSDEVVLEIAQTTSYRWREERRHRANQLYALNHTPDTGGEEESHRAKSSVCAQHTTSLQVERRESHRANQVMRSPHHQIQVGEGERVIEPIKCMLSPHTSYRWRGERVIEPIKCMRSPPTRLQVERRESHRAHQVYALTTHQLQVERRESHRANQSVCAHHTPATGGEERES